MALITNKKVHLDYDILEEIEAGIELKGFEVKSLRAGRGVLAGGRVVVRGDEVFLVGASIPAWQPENAPKEYDQERSRRLLVSKKEKVRIHTAEGQKGLTVVPISVYNRGQFLKMSIGIARGKKKHDKREDIKRRDIERDVARKLKNR